MQWLWSLLVILMLSLPASRGVANPAQEPTGDNALPTKRQELQRLKHQLSESQRHLRRNRTQQQSVLSRLDELHRSQTRLQHISRRTARQLAATQEQVESLRQEHTQWSRQLRQQRQHLIQRLRQLYKLGRRPYVKLLLSAHDVIELSRKVQYIRRLAKHDRQQIQQYDEGQARVAKAQAELTAAEQRLYVQQETLRQQQAALAHERERKTALLRRIREETQLTEQTVAEMTQTVNALTDVIKQLDTARRLEAARRAAARPAAIKGQLLWPLQGPVLSGYGRVRHPDLDVYTVHKGMYIGAALGTAVSAVAAGTVVYADWFKGLGQLLIIDHGNHVLTLYGHTSDLLVQVGEAVDAQQIVAKVGDSSILGEPALYFAIRYNTVPQDPTQWLRQQSARLIQEP